MLSVIKSPKTVKDRVTVHLRNYEKMTTKTRSIMPFYTSPMFCKDFPTEALEVMKNKPPEFVDNYFNQTIITMGEYSTQVDAFIGRLNLLLRFISEEKELLREYREVLALMHNPVDRMWACTKLRNMGYVEHAIAVSQHTK